MKKRCLPVEPRRSVEAGNRFGFVGERFGVGLAPPAENGAAPNLNGADPMEADEESAGS